MLSDHYRVGQRFVPPFVHKLGTLQEVKWIDLGLPELLWIGLVDARHGFKRGAELAIEAARAATAEVESVTKVWFASVSAYGKLSDQDKLGVIATLRAKCALEELRLAIGPLIALYPGCPLSFVFEGSTPSGERSDHLRQLKTVLERLFDKTSRDATMMQANGIYIAFVTGMLVVSSDTSLANFPAVASYPDSEESRQIGSAVRAITNMFFGRSEESTFVWPRYFWNRGLEVDDCLLGGEANIG